MVQGMFMVWLVIGSIPHETLMVKQRQWYILFYPWNGVYKGSLASNQKE